MTRATIIYGLVDPVTTQLRYIGKTVTGLPRRLDGHLRNGRCKINQPSAHWVASLLARGVRPEIVDIEVCPPGSDWEEAEQFWIEYFRAIGCRLLNLSVGGGAGALGWRATEETKRRMSAALTGRPVSEETRKKIGLANKGRPHTDEHRRLNGDARRGEKSHKAKIKEADVPVIRALFAAGYSGTQVGSVFGITKQAADAVRHGESWAHVPELEVDISSIVVPPIHRLRGKNVGTARLNEDAVRDIRRRLAEKHETGKSLAAEYGVSPSIISAVRKRQTWQHVE